LVGGRNVEYDDSSKISTALEIFDQTPHSIWWKNKDLEYTLLNQATADILGYKSSAVSFDGVTDFDHPCKCVEMAPEFHKQDELVMRSKKAISMICFGGYASGSWRVFMGHKYPRYDTTTNEVIGMSGTSVDITNCAVMRTALLLLSDDERLIGEKLNKFDQFTYILKETYDDFKLTVRESECLFLLLRGKITKEIAYILGMAPRTAEHHIENIKIKLGCNSKSELIEKALHHGAGSIILKSIINKQR